MSTLRFLLTVSRPRFWVYIFGPYIVGLAAAAERTSDLLRIENVVFALYFLFPANLLIYGVNDIFDYETDRLNPKKNEYELLVTPASHRTLGFWIGVTNVPFIIALIELGFHAAVPMLGFLFFSIFYSAPPFRAKAVPLVDSAFNILYIFPGAFAYQLVTGSFPPLSLFFAGGLWTMAMHAYSAIPDIAADRKAGVATVATLLGPNGTLFFCLAMYLGSAALAWGYLGWLAIVFGTVYAAMISVSWAAKDNGGVFRIYQYFPMLNTAVGFFLFWFAALDLIR